MSIKNAIVLLIITCIMLLAFIYIKRGVETSTGQIREIILTNDSLKLQIDSLNHEIFHNRTNLGRYEMALEILKENDPNAAKEFETILNTQTE